MNALHGCIHKYFEDEDQTRHYPLNSALVQFIAEQGWIIEDKVAEGSVADVFSCHSSDPNVQLNLTPEERMHGTDKSYAVLILFSNVALDDDSDYNIWEKLLVAKSCPTIFPLIYDCLNSDLPYSNDPEYIVNTPDATRRSIQIIERAHGTLADVIRLFKRNGNIDLIDREEWLAGIKVKIIEFLTVLREKNIYYTDLKLENVGIFDYSTVNIDGNANIEDGNRLKLLDIEGIKLQYQGPYDIEVMAEWLIRDAKELIDEDE